MCDKRANGCEKEHCWYWSCRKGSPRKTFQKGIKYHDLCRSLLIIIIIILPIESELLNVFKYHVFVRLIFYHYYYNSLFMVSVKMKFTKKWLKTASWFKFSLLFNPKWIITPHSDQQQVYISFSDTLEEKLHEQYVVTWSIPGLFITEFIIIMIKISLLSHVLLIDTLNFFLLIRSEL